MNSPSPSSADPAPRARLPLTQSPASAPALAAIEQLLADAQKLHDTIEAERAATTNAAKNPSWIALAKGAAVAMLKHLAGHAEANAPAAPAPAQATASTKPAADTKANP